jgi:TRAP-type C4-dicarboxylate transport system permease small subunit
MALLRALNKALGLLSRVMIVLSTAAGVLMAGVIVASSAMRYLAGAPLAYQEELVGLLFVALVFLALPHCALKDENICVTLARELLPLRAQRIAEFIGDLCVVVFAAVFGLLAWDFTKVSFEVGARSEVANLTLFPWMILMPVGAWAMGVAYLTKAIGYLLVPADRAPAQEGG